MVGVGVWVCGGWMDGKKKRLHERCTVSAGSYWQGVMVGERDWNAKNGGDSRRLHL